MELNNISVSSDKEKIKNLESQKIININKSINITEIQNKSENDNKNISSIYNFINDIPFENLNDYYDIETSLFLKRIEKLNLKFYWTSECILSQSDIQYPYNKLFLILFKQISLYLEEIARLNKRVKQHLKNEKFFQIKIAKLKQKENDNMLNKQMLKNLQINNQLLEKNNEKYKKEIEKLNQKYNDSYKIMSGYNTNINGLYRNRDNNYLTPKFSNTSEVYDNIIKQESILGKISKKISDINTKKNKKNYLNMSVEKRHRHISVSNSMEKTINNKYNKDIINQGINLYNEEIENLEIIEKILKEFKNKNIINMNRSFINNNLDNNKQNKKINIINNSNHYTKVKKKKEIIKRPKPLLKKYFAKTNDFLKNK